MFRSLFLALSIAAFAAPAGAKGSSSRSFTFSKPSRPASSSFKASKPSRPTGSLFKASKPTRSRKPFGLLKTSTAPKPVKSHKSSTVYPPARARIEAKSPTVYITDTGKKYHSAGCSSLRKSSIPISLKAALARGYEACARCGG